MFVLIALLYIPGAKGAEAATNGSLGLTSTGSTVVTVIIPNIFKISGVNDLTLGTYSGTGTMTGNQDLCIYTNRETGSYRVTVTDDTPLSPSGFAVQDQTNTRQIPFTVRWNGTTGTSGNLNMNYNTRRTFSGANTQSTNCSVGGNSANIQVSFTQANLQAVGGGSYSSTLTLFVEP